MAFGELAGDDFPIQPENIDAQRHLWDSFGSREPEVTAGWIVRFCQWRGMGWAPFALDDLLAYYWTGRGVQESFRFNGIDSSGYLVLEEGMYGITQAFVTICHKSSPAS